MKRVHRWAATLAGIGIAALVVVGVLMRLMDGMFEEGQGIRDLEDAGLKRRSIAGGEEQNGGQHGGDTQHDVS